MQTDGRVAHLALNLLLGRQGCHRVNDQYVDGRRANQLVGYLKSLLAVVGLRDVEVGNVYAQLLSIETVEGVFRIDEGGYTAGLLGLGNGVDGQRGLTGRLRTVNLDDAPLGVAAHA